MKTAALHAQSARSDSRHSMTGLGKSIALFGAAVGTGFGLTFFAARGSGRAAEEVSNAQPATSAPAAATAADIAGLRSFIETKFEGEDGRLRGLEADVASIKGYMSAQEKAALTRAISGRRE